MKSENYIIRENIKFKLTKQKLQAINSANLCLTLDIFTDELESALLKSLLLQIHFKIQRKLMENKKTVNFTMTIAEAVAFYKLHHAVIRRYDNYTFAIIHQINSEIHSKLI